MGKIRTRNIMTTAPPAIALSPSQQGKQWIEQPLQLLDYCSEQYGDVFTLELGALGKTVFFSHPKSVETIFKFQSHLFECHQFNVSYRDLMGNNALFLQDGEAHKRLRRIMMPPFHGERVQNYAVDIIKIGQNQSKNWTRGKVIKIRPLMHQIALQAFLEITFGSSEAPINQVKDWFNTEVFKESKGWKPWFNYHHLHSKIRQLIADEINLRKDRNSDTPDLLNWLQLAQDETGQPLTEEEIQDQILTLLITAVDPLAMALTWALYWIHKLPDVQATLRQELETLAGNCDPLNISQLPYLTAICQETLRIHPILPTVSGRRLTERMEIMGYDLDPGVTVAACAYLVHRRPEIYPDPHLFKPERFLNQQFSPYEYFPFGGGNRLCLGSALAPLEMKLVIATLLSSHHLSLISKEPLEMVRYGTLVAPSDQLQMVVLK